MTLYEQLLEDLAAEQAALDAVLGFPQAPDRSIGGIKA
jgi:hypothetical protein